jgi:hypothetical protein
MEDMKNCYDSLLSAAAATTNSVYGNCYFYLYWIKTVPIATSDILSVIFLQSHVIHSRRVCRSHGGNGNLLAWKSCIELWWWWKWWVIVSICKYVWYGNFVVCSYKCVLANQISCLETTMLFFQHVYFFLERCMSFCPDKPRNKTFIHSAHPHIKRDRCWLNLKQEEAVKMGFRRMEYYPMDLDRSPFSNPITWATEPWAGI